MLLFISIHLSFSQTRKSQDEFFLAIWFYIVVILIFSQFQGQRKSFHWITCENSFKSVCIDFKNEKTFPKIQLTSFPLMEAYQIHFAYKIKLFTASIEPWRVLKHLNARIPMYSVNKNLLLRPLCIYRFMYCSSLKKTPLNRAVQHSVQRFSIMDVKRILIEHGLI